MTLFKQLLNDEAGFIISAELVLVATIVVIGLVVGLAELALNVNNELEDVGAAITCIQQTYDIEGYAGHQGWAGGSSFYDEADFCDGQFDIY